MLNSLQLGVHVFLIKLNHQALKIVIYQAHGLLTDIIRYAVKRFCDTTSDSSQCV